VTVILPEDWTAADDIAESEVSAIFKSMIQPYFDLVAQGQMRHVDGKRLRIDYLGVPLVVFPAEVVGFELKGPYQGFKDYTQALKQGIDYRHSTIEDKRLARFEGVRPDFIFICYPAFERQNSTLREWANGAIRLAGRYNVGMLNLLGYRYGVELTVGAERLWHSRNGLRADADTFATHRLPGNN
jgi:hypothetical protein